MSVVPRHPLIIDASVAVAWCISTEATAPTDQLLIEASRTGILVPAIWWVEVANSMVMASRRGRLSSGDWARFEGLLTDFVITQEAIFPHRVVQGIAQVSQVHGLTVYDGTHLELAQRTEGRLATLDKRLKAAASSVGVELIDVEN